MASDLMVTGQVESNELAELIKIADEYVETRFEVWRSWRRHLHANPERSWQERQTTEFILSHLREMDLDHKPGPRDLGAIVNIHSGDVARLKTFAMRGDIDAIPVMEANDVEYCSRVPGTMHGCGHDVHTTVLLAVCDTLNHLVRTGRAPNPICFRALFQPAEEVAEGATGMVQSGALDGVEAIVAMHVDSSRKVGEIGLRDGVQTACCDEIRVVLNGPGGHGARPHETSDTIFAASRFVSAAYALVPRIVDARQKVVLSFCKIAGGDSANVIPTQVEILGTLRSFDRATRDLVFSRLESLAKSIGESMQVDIEFLAGVSIPSVNNSSVINALVQKSAESFLPAAAIEIVEPSLGGEDFACYQKHIPGSLIRVGSAGNDDFGRAHLHSPHFDVDEQVIGVACRLFIRTILNWFHSQELADS